MNFVSARGNKKFNLEPRMSADWRAMLGGHDPGFFFGSTDRLTTLDRIRIMRYVTMPRVMDFIRRKEVSLQQYSGRSLENARRGEDELPATALILPRKIRDKLQKVHNNSKRNFRPK